MKKIIRVFEIIFLIMTVLSIVECVRLYIQGNTEMSLLFAGFAVLSFFMNRLRRKQRLRIEEQEKQQ